MAQEANATRMAKRRERYPDDPADPLVRISDRVPQSWAHLLPGPEKGCVLLASPQHFKATQRYFHEAAILILNYGPGGALGLILNKPTGGKMEDAALLPGHRIPFAHSKCASQPLHCGGDVGACILMLHVHNVPGAVEVLSDFLG